MTHDTEKFLAWAHVEADAISLRARVNFVLRVERIGLAIEVAQARQRRDRSRGVVDTAQPVSNTPGERVNVVASALQRAVTAIPFFRRVG